MTGSIPERSANQRIAYEFSVSLRQTADLCSYLTRKIPPVQAPCAKSFLRRVVWLLLDSRDVIGRTAGSKPFVIGWQIGALLMPLGGPRFPGFYAAGHSVE